MACTEPEFVVQKLREFNGLNDRILDNVPIAIYVVDREYTVLKWNKYLEKSTLNAKADILGRKIVDVMPEMRSDGRYESLRQVMESGEPFHELGQKMLRCAGDGNCEERFHDVSIVPLREAEMIVGAITILSDVTLRRRAEEKRRQAELEVARSHARLADYNRSHAVGELAAAIAHEISQPLASIGAYAHAVLNRLEGGRDDGQKLVELLNKIKDQAAHAGNIVDHARAISKKRERLLEPLDLNELAAEAARLVEFDLMLHDCDLSMQLADVPLRVMADAVQVQRAIINLLRNAMDAITAANASCRTIEVATHLDAEGVRLTVADRGDGVDAANIERLFDPFYSTREGGLGIGLGLCRDIMAIHGGAVQFIQRDEGAEFSLVFPTA